MKALYYPAHDELLIAERPIPDYLGHEVLVKVLACGICGSELETFKSHSTRRVPPLIMGHEFCGVIEAVGQQVKDWKKGARVVSNSVVSCGECQGCKSGRTNLCERRQVFGMHRDGAFGAYVNVPASSLIAMPSRVDPRQACITEPLANGVHLVKLTSHVPLENILVIGAGPIGLTAQQAFRALREVKIMVADIRQDRLQIAAQIGANAIINPAKEDLYSAVYGLTGGQPVDLVVDAVGAGQTNKAGLDIVKPGGTLLMIGLYDNSRALSSYDIVLSEKSVIGSYAATQEDMQDALTLIAEGRVDVSSWVHYYNIDDGRQAFFDMMAAKENHVKSVIVFE